MLFVLIMIFMIVPIFVMLVLFCHGCWKLHKLEKVLLRRWDEGNDTDS